MRYRLRRWWNITTLWPICFAILFGQDVTAIDFERNFDLFSLISSFPPKDMMAVFPGVFPVIVGMLQNGLKTVIRDQQDPNSPRDSPITPQREGKFSRQAPKSHGRSRSMSLQAEVDLLSKSDRHFLASFATWILTHPQILTYQGKKGFQSRYTLFKQSPNFSQTCIRTRPVFENLHSILHMCRNCCFSYSLSL